MGLPLLKEIFIIFVLSVFVLFIFHRLRIPAIVGFILTGIVAGPYGLGLVKAVGEVEKLAEIGIVCLLFTVGLEFSFKSLFQLKRSFFLGGAFQVGITALAGFLVARMMSFNLGTSIFIGFLVSHTSTTIMLKLLQDKAQIDSPQGQTALAISLFQDVMSVPMMFFIPLLAGGINESQGSLWGFLIKAGGVLLLVIVSARWLVPKLLYQIARTRHRELFLLVIVVIALAVAWLTNYVGLSLALGAFLAGLIISESEYSHQALGNILPFRDIFTSFFFVSIGMLLDLNFVLGNPGMIIMLVLLVLLIKALIGGLATLILGYPLRTIILVGLALCQVGEFAFVLSRSGLSYGLLAGENYQIFLAVSVLTMAVNPFIMMGGDYLADYVSTLPLPRKLQSGWVLPELEVMETKKDHLVIIGYGVNGRNLAKTARMVDIPYEIIEMNPETVRVERKQGEPIHYGDATHSTVLEQANIKSARIAVIAINDPTATRRITELVRRMNTNIFIIVRTRYLSEMKPLYELGANEVIPEEFETSVEIFTRVLNKYLVPKDEIEKLVAEIRSGGYQALRSLSRERADFSDLKLNLSDLEITTFRIMKNAPAQGKTIGELGIRKKYGVTIVALQRGRETLNHPGAESLLLANDILVIIGSPDKIAEASFLFTSKAGEKD